LTVGAYLAQWLEESAKPKLKPSTYRSYEQLIRVHLVPALGKHKLRKLGPQHVQAFLNEKSQSGLSPRTRQYLLAVLRAALNRAVKWQLVAHNVALLVDPPRVPRVEMAPFSPEMASRFLTAATGHRHAHLFEFLLATGSRIGEALALRWTDIDLAGGTVRVRFTLGRLTGSPWRLIEPKSVTGRRALPLIGPAVITLQAQQLLVAEMRSRLPAGVWHDHGFVFPAANGEPLDANNVLHEFKKILKRAGLPTTYRVHDLRHTTATYLLAAGAPVRTAMELMGHSQISMTMRYQHVLPAMLGDAAARLESVFPRAMSVNTYGEIIGERTDH
jgi:integrase